MNMPAPTSKDRETPFHYNVVAQSSVVALIVGLLAGFLGGAAPRALSALLHFDTRLRSLSSAHDAGQQTLNTELNKDRDRLNALEGMRERLRSRIADCSLLVKPQGTNPLCLVRDLALDRYLNQWTKSVSLGQLPDNYKKLWNAVQSAPDDTSKWQDIDRALRLTAVEVRKVLGKCEAVLVAEMWPAAIAEKVIQVTPTPWDVKPADGDKSSLFTDLHAFAGQLQELDAVLNDLRLYLVLVGRLPFEATADGFGLALDLRR